MVPLPAKVQGFNVNPIILWSSKYNNHVLLFLNFFSFLILKGALNTVYALITTTNIQWRQMWYPRGRILAWNLEELKYFNPGKFYIKKSFQSRSGKKKACCATFSTIICQYYYKNGLKCFKKSPKCMRLVYFLSISFPWISVAPPPLPTDKWPPEKGGVN